MKQIIKINAEYEFTEKQKQEWEAQTTEQKEDRIIQAKEALAETLEDFNILELTVEMK